MKADPEREAEAERRFTKLLNDAKRRSDVVIIGREAGPRPARDLLKSE